jgi:hypothetical protein
MSKHSRSSGNHARSDGRLQRTLGRLAEGRVEAPARLARWLQAAGFDEAAAAVARGSREGLPPFWTPRRLAALDGLTLDGGSADYPEEPWATGALLSKAGEALLASAVLLVLAQSRRGVALRPATAVRVRRALAVLLVAVEDATREVWPDGLADVPFVVPGEASPAKPGRKT